MGFKEALDYFRSLGHGNHPRLSKFYAWQEKKSKTSWGAETVDYGKIPFESTLASDFWLLSPMQVDFELVWHYREGTVLTLTVP
jgi:hypothetical protein